MPKIDERVRARAEGDAGKNLCDEIWRSASTRTYLQIRKRQEEEEEEEISLAAGASSVASSASRWLRASVSGARMHAAMHLRRRQVVAGLCLEIFRALSLSLRLSLPSAKFPGNAW